MQTRSDPAQPQDAVADYPFSWSRFSEQLGRSGWIFAMYYGIFLGILAFSGTDELSLGIFMSSVTMLTVFVILDIAVCSPYPTIPSRFLRIDETFMPLRWKTLMHAIRGASLLAFLLSIRSMSEMNRVELIDYLILCGGIILVVNLIGFAVRWAWRNS